MAGTILDLDAELRQIKLDEKFKGFAGFFITLPGEAQKREGLIKIAVDRRENNSGLITLTFLLDTENSSSTTNALYEVIFKAASSNLKTALKGSLWDIVVSESSMDSSSAWSMVDVDFFAKKLGSKDSSLIAEKIFPALNSCLDKFTVEEAQWFDDQSEEAATLSFSQKLGFTFKNLFEK